MPFATAATSTIFGADEKLFGDWSFSHHRARPGHRYDRLVWADRDLLRIERCDADADAVLVTFPGLASFEVDTAHRTIGICRHLADLSDNTLRHLLADQVLPRLVSHEGRLVIHAAGIASPTGTILLVGVAGRGKSTLAASFHVNGHALLGDDAMLAEVVDASAVCRPLYRSLRLFPDSIAAVFEAEPHGEPVADYTDKRNIIDLERLEDAEGRTPIRSIYCLAAAEADDIQVRRMEPTEACMAIVEQSFALDPGDRERAQLRLRQAAEIVSCVPMFEIAYRRDYAALPALRERILADGVTVDS